MLGVSSVTCGAMADDEGGRRAEQWLKVNESAVALAKGSGDPR
jgi:hypothetical protein